MFMYYFLNITRGGHANLLQYHYAHHFITIIITVVVALSDIRTSYAQTTTTHNFLE